MGASFIFASKFDHPMNNLKKKLNDVLSWPDKKKGVALIMLSVFLFFSTLLLSTREWDSEGSFLSNVWNADLELFETSRREVPNIYGGVAYVIPYYLIDIPFKLFGLSQ